jgi:hypothetical protein
LLNSRSGFCGGPLSAKRRLPAPALRARSSSAWCYVPKVFIGVMNAA